MKRKKFLHFFYLFLIFAGMAAAWGYTIGHENSIQLVPYAQHLHDNNLFSKDFFVQSASENFLNERSFFILLLQPFGQQMAWPVFILYLLCTILLFHALYKIAFVLTGNHLLSYMALLILVFPLNYHALGLNELFGRDFNSSLVSDTAAAWAFYFFLVKRIWPTYLMLILSTLMHPLSGLQAFLLITAAELILFLREKSVWECMKVHISPVALYCITGGLFVIALQFRLNDIQWNDADFFQSFFVFRNAHHYIPTHYSKTDWFILGPVYLLTPILLFRINKGLSIVAMFIIAGCAIYSYGVLKLESPFIASTQWFKTTMWLEFFAIAAVLRTIANIFPAFLRPLPGKVALATVADLCIAWVLIIFPGTTILKNETNYEFPFYTRTTPEIDISILAGKTTPTDALFLQPCSLEELKYYSCRSSYLDFKALTHTKGFIREWAERFDDIYGIDPKTSEVVSFAVIGKADENFRHLTVERFLELKAETGVTHIIAFADMQLPFRVLASNEKYTVYEL